MTASQSIPFFRGQNYTDWLVALMIQSAVEQEDNQKVILAASIIGSAGVEFFLHGTDKFPTVAIVDTNDYLFVVSGGTKSTWQWIGNLLGSASSNWDGITGRVPAYFGLTATLNFVGLYDRVKQRIGSRKLVFIGFSLGAATTTILKQMFENFGLKGAAGIAFACPRVGDGDFIAAFPSDNYSNFQVFPDPVPSVPPAIWSAIGVFVAYKPIGPLVFWQTVTPAYYLDQGDNLHYGQWTTNILDVFARVLNGKAIAVHNQPAYALKLREKLPFLLPLRWEGFAHGDQIDDVAPRVLYPEPEWIWTSVPRFHFSGGGPGMGSQIGIFIRDTSRQLGFEEVYYSSAIASSPLFNAVGTSLVPARQKMLATPSPAVPRTGCEIYAWRLSNVGGPRKSYLMRPGAPLVGTYPYTQGMATVEQCVSYLGFDVDGLVKRQFHFRGVDSSAILDEQVIPGGYFDTLVNSSSSSSFINVLKALNVCIHSTRPPTPLSYPVTGASQAAQGDLITLNLVAPAGFVPGTIWDLRGVRGPGSILNGRYQAVGPQIANQLMLSGTQRYSCPATISGTVFQVGANFIPLGSMSLTGAGKRDTGRPPFSQRGRQSPVLKRR